MVSKRPASTWLINEIEREFRSKNYYMVLRDLGNVGEQGRDLIADQALRTELASYLAGNKNVYSIGGGTSTLRNSEGGAGQMTDVQNGQKNRRNKRGGVEDESLIIGGSSRGDRKLTLPKPPEELTDEAAALITWCENQAMQTDIAMHNRLETLKVAANDMEAASSKIKNILRESTAMDGSFRITILYLVKGTESEQGHGNNLESKGDNRRRAKVAKKAEEGGFMGAAEIISFDQWEMLGVLANSRQLINETELRCVSSRVQVDDPAEGRRIEMLFALYLLHQAVFMPHIEVCSGAGSVKGLRYASYLMTDLFVFPLHVSWLFHFMKTPTHWTSRESLNYVHSGTSCRCRQPFRRRICEPTTTKIEMELTKTDCLYGGAEAARLQSIYDSSCVREDGIVTSQNYQHSAASICKEPHPTSHVNFLVADSDPDSWSFFLCSPADFERFAASQSARSNVVNSLLS